MEYRERKYKELLMEENSKHNLISRKSGSEEIEKHLLDSKSILDYLSKEGLKTEGLKIVDIGSGAGFPGLILAMNCPHARFTLVEADLKKSLFLEKVKAELGLDNVVVKRERAEKMGQNPEYRESFDICVSRAVARINVLLEYALPLVKIGGKAVLWKGKNYRGEIEEAQKALTKLGGDIEAVHGYDLVAAEDRVLVIIKKKERTAENYPRKVGIPSKRPL